MEYRVDSRSLKLFLAVAEQGSIGRAAEAIPITQPALSKHMQRLEAQLGVTLFQRTSVGIELTPFGQALAVHARTVLAEVQRLQNRMADLREGRAGQVAIGAGAGILESYVAPAVTRLTHRYPDVRVTAAAGLAEDLLPALRDGELDILAGSRPAAGWPEEIVCTPWFKDEIGIVVRVGHPLQRRRGLTLESLRDSRWVLPPRQHTFTRSCVACFQSAGIAPPGSDDRDDIGDVHRPYRGQLRCLDLHASGPHPRPVATTHVPITRAGEYLVPRGLPVSSREHRTDADHSGAYAGVDGHEAI